MTWKAAKYFLGFVRKYAAQETLLLVLVAVSSAGVLVSPYVLKILIDDVFPSADFRLLAEVLAVYALLSGGELQRVALARGMLRKACVTIMDEATSAVDSENEKRIIENLLEENKNGIVIIVSHRLSAVRKADCIVCLHDGAVAEQGTHDELVSKGGFYRKLFEEQLDGQ